MPTGMETRRPSTAFPIGGAGVVSSNDLTRPNRLLR